MAGRQSIRSENDATQIGEAVVTDYRKSSDRQKSTSTPGHGRADREISSALETLRSRGSDDMPHQHRAHIQSNRSVGRK
jgi:hypothetical protein